MITLPAEPGPNAALPELIDAGIVLRSSTGAGTARINRKGSRFRASFTFPPMPPATSSIFISRLLSAKSEGLRLPWHLGEAQGAPGAPQVNGAGQSGTTLQIKGLTPGYQIREGFWLSIVDALGQHYLHNVRSAATASLGGLAVVAIAPALRVPFANSATIHLAAPQIEGLVDSVVSWEIPTSGLIALEFTIEEAA